MIELAIRLPWPAPCKFSAVPNSKRHSFAQIDTIRVLRFTPTIKSLHRYLLSSHE